MSGEHFPNPFDDSIHKTEWTCASLIAGWMNEIIKEQHLDLGEALVETKKKHEPERNDIIIRENPRSEKVLCCIEFKIPQYDCFDEKNLKRPAQEKANQSRAKYFCTSNFKLFVWFNTEKANANLPDELQIHQKYHLSEIENIDLMEEPRFKRNIIDGLTRFLFDLYEVHTDKKPEPHLPIDEFLIFRLQEKIKSLTRLYLPITRDKTHKDTAFRIDLQKWFIEQNWSFSWSDSDFDKAARQAAYLLVNKILFYDLLQSKRPNKLEVLEIPESLFKGKSLQAELQRYFNDVLEIDYESIYDTDFIDQTAFPESKEVVHEIKELIALLRRYDFSLIGYDIIGRIFERLIPSDERHALGQYFTNADVVDLILRFCLKHENDKVFDPSCGAGTFLVRAYQHKKILNNRLRHQDILKTLWGCDIAKFPSHLSTINLAVNDLSVDDNYPQIFHEDFFNLRLGGREEFGIEARKRMISSLGEKKTVLDYPKIVDCIVGNPPYTRQEEIADISQTETYKAQLIHKALLGANGKPLARISKRAGIYAYFFVHGTKFLQNGGRFGFVVSNSWLDADYGVGLQEFFLKNYKITAIIESKMERWFEDADINTCIIILERCTSEKERYENLVRFTYLFKPLRHFIPPTSDIWDKQLSRLHEIDKLIKTILAHNKFYQNDELRVYPKKQGELWEEGLEIVAEPESYVSTKKKHEFQIGIVKEEPVPYSNRNNNNENEVNFTGTKWGRYVRAPEIFFTILEKGRDKFISLKEIAKVKRGFTTGVNEFFYLSEEEIKRRGIEKEFWMHKEDGRWTPNYIVRSPRECTTIELQKDDLKNRVLLIHKLKNQLKGTKVLKYIMEGERKGFHLRPTCLSRGDKWYDLGFQEPPDLIWFKAFNDRVLSPINIHRHLSGDRMYAIYLKKSNFKIKTAAILNSTVSHLFVELWGRVNLGEGALDNMTYETASMLTIHPRYIPSIVKKPLSKLSKRNIGSIFEELGAKNPNDVSFDKVKPDRRELDKIIMGEILGLSESEQLEVYRAVIDLVKSRLEKAKSVGKKKTTKEGIDIDALVKVVIDQIEGKTLGKFYRENILILKKLTTITLHRKEGKVRIIKEIFDWYLYAGRNKIRCSSELEARYLKIWLEAGAESINIPQDENDIRLFINELEKLKSRIDTVVDFYLHSIVDKKTKSKIAHEVWNKLTE